LSSLAGLGYAVCSCRAANGGVAILPPEALEAGAPACVVVADALVTAVHVTQVAEATVAVGLTPTILVNAVTVLGVAAAGARVVAAGAPTCRNKRDKTDMCEQSNSQ
jgi:hypothetical protein